MSMVTYLRNTFLKIFGDIKIFPFPFFILYDPGSYKVKGHEVRKIIETIQPGDILIRGYSNYLDGFFIPGFFSHAGLYLGSTSKAGLLLPEVIEAKFYESSQVVIHSMAEGVFMEDLLNFCKCDYLLILRRNNTAEPNEDISKSMLTIYNKAIQNLGKQYDFKFNFSEIGNLSCTEFVYVCCESFLNKYKVSLKERSILFRKRKVLLPDDFITEHFTIQFSSNSIPKNKLAEIIQKNK